MFKLALVTLVLVIELELALQLVGWALKKRTWLYNAVSRNQNELKILVLGDCISSDAMYLHGNPWPRVLERMLVQQGVPAKVFNDSSPATTSAVAARKIRSLLERYQPDVVVSMLGIVDKNAIWLREIGIIQDSHNNFFQRLKIYKLARALAYRERFLSGSQEGDVGTAKPRASDLGYHDISKIIELIRENRYAAVEKMTDAFLLGKTHVEKSQFYAFIGKALLKSWRAEKSAFQKSLRYHKKSVEHSLEVALIPESLALVAVEAGKTEECYWLMDQYATRGKAPTLEAVQALSQCVPRQSERMQTFLAKHAPHFSLQEQEESLSTRENYRHVVMSAQAAGACAVATQYPLRPVSEIAGYFSEKERRDVVFVSNEDNFSNLEKTNGKNPLFMDLFASDIGHLTDTGNNILAKRVSEAIIAAVKQGKCNAGAYGE